MAREVRFGVRLTGDAKGAVNAMRLTDKELGKLRRELDRTDRSVRKHQRGLQAWSAGLMSVQRVLAPLAGIAGVSLLARTTRNVIEQTAAISESADMAGITAERYQELTKAFADMAGVTEDQTSASLLRFNRRLGLAADGSGAAKDAFTDLGVAMRLTSGDLRGTEVVLEEVMRGLAGIENSAERAAKASLFFGDRSGPQLAAALGQGEDALNAQIDALREHGRILANEAVANARAANDELNRMRDILSTRMNQQILDHADSYMHLARALGLVAEKSMDFLATTVELDRFLAESAAARIGGIAGDDIVRLEDEADRIRDALEGGIIASGQRLRFFGPGGIIKWWSKEELEDELTRIDAAIADYYSSPRTPTTTLPPVVVRGDALPDLPGSPTAAPAIDRFPEQFQNLADRLDPVSAATRQYMESVTMLDEAWSRSIISGERHWDLMNRMATGEALEGVTEELEEIIETTDRLDTMGASLGMSFASGFEEAIISGGRFRDILQGISQDVLRIATRTLITTPLANAAGDFFSGMFPGRASGGPVSGGSAYVVGERGPELFMPRSSGSIVPNNAIGGGVQVNVINNVGAKVTTRERQTPQGPSLDVMIDQAVAEKLSQRGSASNSAMRTTFNARTKLAGR